MQYLALSVMIATAPQSGYQPPWPADSSARTSIQWQVDHLDLAPAAIVWLEDGMVASLERDTVRRTGSVVRAWFRWEALNQEQADQWGARSMLVLREMDCDQRRTRLLAASLYKGTNLTGSHEDHNEPDGGRAWTYDRPGMLGAAQTAAACDGVFLLPNLAAPQ